MFQKRLVPFAILIFLSSVLGETSISPQVTLHHGGVLVGSYLKTVSGKSIQGFRGIPYAEPPVGDLRFKEPVPAKLWKGEKLATKDAQKCSQQDPFFRNFVTTGAEDCLYINVYTQNAVNMTKHKRPLSVMVFIHGGGWVAGGGSSDLYGPGRIMDNDNIILVTFNYRLGALGFLSTGSKYSPGNNGLKDQVLALKWVRSNIRAFGGNPNDVTLFGESAGAASVTYHMTSPLSIGLFHKAIIESGTNQNAWALATRSTANVRAKKLGELLNCNAKSSKQLLKCLRTKSADAITSTMQNFFEFDNFPQIAFPPVVEPYLNGAFLPRPPRDVVTSHSASIPIIIGVTADEGIVVSGPLLNLYDDLFKSKFNEVLPLMLAYDKQPQDIQKLITSKVDQFYFQGQHDWTKANHQNLTNMFSDRHFYSGMDKYLQKRFAASNRRGFGKTFVYVFDHQGPFSFAQLMHSSPETTGICHVDDLLYLFPFGGEAKGNDATMKWALPKMWVDFAKTGNPTPPGSSIQTWEPAQNFPLKYARLGNKNEEEWEILKNEVGLADERIQFWREIEELL